MRDARTARSTRKDHAAAHDLVARSLSDPLAPIADGMAYLRGWRDRRLSLAELTACERVLKVATV